MPKSEQMLPVRRGGSLDRGSYETLTPMGSPDSVSGAEAGKPTASADGISALIARILDQLALSAWLPAAFLTASIAVLLQFRSAKSANVLKAIQELTVQPLQVLVLVIPILVIATVVTQAFSFECIRILEGYWGASRLADLVRRPMVWLHVHKQGYIVNQLRKESRKALLGAMPRMLMSGIPFPVVKAIEARVVPEQSPPSLTDEEAEILKELDWRPWCDAWRLARIGNLAREAEQYPVSHHVMPTKLGNLMRATEDKLQNAGNDVQSFVYRRREVVPTRVRIQHDQFRTRLEMYCTLVLVNGFLLALAPITLVGRVSNTAFAVAFAGFAAMGIVSYLAAIASASGYCLILKQMDETT
jgi:hypothetical protein